VREDLGPCWVWTDAEGKRNVPRELRGERRPDPRRLLRLPPLRLPTMLAAEPSLPGDAEGQPDGREQEGAAKGKARHPVGRRQAEEARRRQGQEQGRGEGAQGAEARRRDRLALRLVPDLVRRLASVVPRRDRRDRDADDRREPQSAQEFTRTFFTSPRLAESTSAVSRSPFRPFDTSHAR